MKFQLGQVACALGQTAACAGAPVTGWSVDSRTLAPGDLFFALRGPNHDGHVFVEDVLRRGAVAAVVDHARRRPAHCWWFPTPWRRWKRWLPGRARNGAARWWA